MNSRHVTLSNDASDGRLSFLLSQQYEMAEKIICTCDKLGYAFYLLPGNIEQVIMYKCYVKISSLQMNHYDDSTTAYELKLILTSI